MRNSIWPAGVLILAVCAHASAQSPAANMIRNAAEALGGEDRILSIRTLEIDGYGQEAAQNGGANASASVHAPQRWNHILGWKQTMDLENGRIRVRQRTQAWVAAATLSRVFGDAVNTSVLDGDVPYTVSTEGEARRAGPAAARSLRVEMLTHPVVLVRAALDPTTLVENLRNQGALAVVDITPEGEGTFTLAVERESRLPAWVSWTENNGTLRDLTLQKRFTGFEPIDGVMMPTGFKTVSDFRNTVQSEMYVTRNSVDQPIDDLAAAPAVRTAAPPPPNPPTVEATPVAEGIWLLHGNRGHNSILIEFADHLTMFEVPLNEDWTLALIEAARSAVPGKPLTEAIVSHHHFDHSGGVRAAIAEGLTIIAHRGTEDLFREVAARPSTVELDALARNPQPLNFVPVGDRMKLRDDSMEVDLYHIIGDEHMSEALMAYVPRHRLLIQADLFDYTWQNYPWGSVYADNVRLRNLNVERDVPVHGVVMPWEEVVRSIEEKYERTQQVCMGPEAPFLPACEVAR